MPNILTMVINGPLNGYEDEVFRYLKEKHIHLDLSYFDVVAYVERCFENQDSMCPLGYGAECVGFESDIGRHDEASHCPACTNFHNRYCGRYNIDMAKFHEDIRLMLDIES